MKDWRAAISLAFTAAILGLTQAGAQLAEAPKARVFHIARLIDGRADVVHHLHATVSARAIEPHASLEHGVEGVDRVFLEEEQLTGPGLLNARAAGDGI